MGTPVFCVNSLACASDNSRKIASTFSSSAVNTSFGFCSVFSIPNAVNTSTAFSVSAAPDLMSALQPTPANVLGAYGKANTLFPTFRAYFAVMSAPLFSAAPNTKTPSLKYANILFLYSYENARTGVSYGCIAIISPFFSTFSMSAIFPWGKAENPPASTQITFPLPESAPSIAAQSPPSAVPVTTVNVSEISRAIFEPSFNAPTGVVRAPTTAILRAASSRIFPTAQIFSGAPETSCHS